MQLAQLHMVKQILETGSLSKTALRLNWAQSVVSRQLAAFESECGGRIFYRNGRGVVLTELGEHILPLVDTMINAAEEMTKCGAELRNELSGEVKVSIGPQIAPILSGPLLAKLKQDHPNIRLSVWEAYSHISADLKEGRTDVAVFMHNYFTGEEDDEVIGEIDNYLIGLPGSAPLSEDTIEFSQLCRLPLVMPSSPNSWRRTIEQIAARENVTLTIAGEANAPSSTSALMYAGIGYVIAPLISGRGAEKMGWVGEDVRAKRLQASRIINPGFSSKLYVSKGMNRNRSVDAVTRLIVSIMSDIMDTESDYNAASDNQKLQIATG